jgi:hypothetical protein
MSNHLTRLARRLDAASEIEILTHDPAVQHKAGQAWLNAAILDFVFWNGESEEIIEGKVTSCRSDEPFRFTVKRELREESMQPRTAEPRDRNGPRAVSPTPPVVPIRMLVQPDHTISLSSQTNLLPKERGCCHSRAHQATTTWRQAGEWAVSLGGSSASTRS